MQENLPKEDPPKLREIDPFEEAQNIIDKEIDDKANDNFVFHGIYDRISEINLHIVNHDNNKNNNSITANLKESILTQDFICNQMTSQSFFNEEMMRKCRIFSQTTSQDLSDEGEITIYNKTNDIRNDFNNQFLNSNSNDKNSKKLKNSQNSNQGNLNKINFQNTKKPKSQKKDEFLKIESMNENYFNNERSQEFVKRTDIRFLEKVYSQASNQIIGKNMPKKKKIIRNNRHDFSNRSCQRNNAMNINNENKQMLVNNRSPYCDNSNNSSSRNLNNINIDSKFKWDHNMEFNPVNNNSNNMTKGDNQTHEDETMDRPLDNRLQQRRDKKIRESQITNNTQSIFENSRNKRSILRGNNSYIDNNNYNQNSNYFNNYALNQPQSIIGPLNDNINNNNSFMLNNLNNKYHQLTNFDDKNGFLSEGLKPYKFLAESAGVIGIEINNPADVRKWWNTKNKDFVHYIKFRVEEKMKGKMLFVDDNGVKQKVPFLYCKNLQKNEYIIIKNSNFHDFPFELGKTYGADLLLVYESFEIIVEEMPDTYDLINPPQELIEIHDFDYRD